ncbi:MAG TPA: PQQ-binding-like beta-propeller repeat protein [Bacteroidales bacterium]|nr:PQQ-binding-like beta-propeller repeat protein [Bacteroidales bacterium]HQB21526.1 PQQ-binding-like beta-propeller repeat protein [Bacteroidales bacterium]
MKLNIRVNPLINIIIAIAFIFFCSFSFLKSPLKQKDANNDDGIKLIIPTFLGNEERNYYGNIAPESLDIIWKTNLGCGQTIFPNKEQEVRDMCGAGWTGQALLVEDQGELFLIQGAYDYNLRKIKARNGKVVWKYPYEDVIKSTGCVWVNPNKAKDDPDKIVIFQGSRRGFEVPLYEKYIFSYRAISFRTGKELWRYNSVYGGSFSRDVDGTALIVDDTIFLGLETGDFVKLNPNPDSAQIIDSYKQPVEFFKQALYTKEDIQAHRRNVVIESAPSLLDNFIFVTSGAGYLYKYDRNNGLFDIQFKTGSDMDGSPIITRDKKVLISIEKEYIPGNGGAMLIDPTKHKDSCVVWFYPTGDKHFVSWQGGIIGSCAINDKYISENDNSLAAFVGIDGYLYVVENEFINPYDSVKGPCDKILYPQPQEIFKYETGPSISTPIFTKDRLIVLTYEGLYMFEYDKNCNFSLLEKNSKIRGEATPIIHYGRLFVASRDGNLYCLGKLIKNEE